MGTTKRTSTRAISQQEMDETWAYAKAHFGDLWHYELLARYRPEVVHGYMTLRQAAFNEGPSAALPSKIKELVITAIEVARTKSNPPPVIHARRAIEAGATPAEVAEVVSLCILIGGMLTYAESGRHALKAAEERYAELHPQGG